MKNVIIFAILTAISTVAVAGHHKVAEGKHGGGHKISGLFEQADLDKNGSIPRLSMRLQWWRWLISGAQDLWQWMPMAMVPSVGKKPKLLEKSDTKNPSLLCLANSAKSVFAT